MKNMFYSAFNHERNNMNNLEKHISFFDGKRIYGDFNRLGKLFKTKNHQ